MSKSKQLTTITKRNPLADLETPLGGVVTMSVISNRMLERLTDKIELAEGTATLRKVITAADLEAAIWAADHLRDMIKDFEGLYYEAFNAWELAERGGAEV